MLEDWCLLWKMLVDAMIALLMEEEEEGDRQEERRRFDDRCQAFRPGSFHTGDSRPEPGGRSFLNAESSSSLRAGEDLRSRSMKEIR